MEPEVVLEREPEAVEEGRAAPDRPRRRTRNPTARPDPDRADAPARRRRGAKPRRGAPASADEMTAANPHLPADERPEGASAGDPVDPQGPVDPEGPEGSPNPDGPGDPGSGSTGTGGASREAPAKLGPGEQLSDEELERRLSALLFCSPEPLGPGRLASLLEGPSPARVQAALEALAKRLEASGLPIELREIAGGHQLLSTADVFDTVARLAKVRREEKVSPAALETLAVVAYRQPVTKAEIEAIRGVQVGPILRALVDRRLVRVVGRAEVPGQPLLYGTTRRFLESFGLAGLKELPRDSELVRD